MVTPPMSAEQAMLERQTQNAASWFLWIAGLTIVNVVTALGGLSFGFALSLMAPIGMAYLAHSHGAMWEYIVTGVLTILGAGLFALFWHFGKRAARWALITGMVLYGIDALLWLGVRDFLGIAIHAYALWRIGASLGPAKRLAELRRQSAQTTAMAGGTPWYGGTPTTEAQAQWPPAPSAAPSPPTPVPLEPSPEAPREPAPDNRPGPTTG